MSYYNRHRYILYRTVHIERQRCFCRQCDVGENVQADVIVVRQELSPLMPKDGGFWWQSMIELNLSRRTIYCYQYFNSITVNQGHAAYDMLSRNFVPKNFVP